MSNYSEYVKQLTTIRNALGEYPEWEQTVKVIDGIIVEMNTITRKNRDPIDYLKLSDVMIRVVNILLMLIGKG